MKCFRKIQVEDPASNSIRDCHLVKYGAREYSTIRIGTLEYFRELEGAQSDPMDGRVEGLIFKGPSGPMQWEELDRTMRDSNVKIVASDGIQFGPNGSISDNVPRACPNVFIFCCSMEFNVFPNFARAQHFKAKTHSVIDNPAKLIAHVQQSLLENVCDSEGNRLVRGEHYIRAWHAPVRYKSRIPADVCNEVNDLDLFVFQKDPKFQLEQEYRFAWAFFESRTNKQVWVQRDPIDVPMSWIEGIAHVSI